MGCPDIDDRPWAISNNVPTRKLTGTEIGSIQDDVGNGTPGVRAHVLRRDWEVRRCVVDENICEPEFRFDGVESICDLVRLADVALCGEPARTNLLDGRDARCPVLFASADDGNCCTQSGEL